MKQKHGSTCLDVAHACEKMQRNVEVRMKGGGTPCFMREGSVHPLVPGTIVSNERGYQGAWWTCLDCSNRVLSIR